VPVNTVTAMGIGAAVWFVAFCVLLVLLVVRGPAAEAAHRQWLWTTLAGWLLGLVGMVVARWQRHSRSR
jgi:hypothetical protein